MKVLGSEKDQEKFTAKPFELILSIYNTKNPKGKKLYQYSYDFSHLIKKGVIKGLMVPQEANQDGFKFELELSVIHTKVKQNDISSVALNALNQARDSNDIVGHSGADIKHGLGFYADVFDDY